jgi:hypothetical protein
LLETMSEYINLVLYKFNLIRCLQRGKGKVSVMVE